MEASGLVVGPFYPHTLSIILHRALKIDIRLQEENSCRPAKGKKYGGNITCLPPQSVQVRSSISTRILFHCCTEIQLLIF